jgi:sodium/potassium-transporting ATPase subunit alpha
VFQGAPERIIDLCTKIRIGSDDHDLDDYWKKIFNDVYEEIGGMGERVIGKTLLENIRVSQSK